MRVLKQISTGKIISWMTGASAGTLTSNERTIASSDLIESDMPHGQLRSEWKTQRDAEETYVDKRRLEYPAVEDFMEAYTEKEIGSDSTKWDAYVIAYNKVRTDNPKS